MSRSIATDPDARGKTLVILNESGTNERSHATAVARALPANDFTETWVIGPDSFEHASVTYAATKPELDTKQPPVFKVQINSLFTSRKVVQIPSRGRILIDKGPRPSFYDVAPRGNGHRYRDRLVAIPECVYIGRRGVSTPLNAH